MSNIRNGKECVLLAEPDNSFRAALVNVGDHTIVEREHLASGIVNERLWQWHHGELSLTGQRIFREPLTVQPSEPAENPVHDEMVIKEPLRFTPHDTPNGFGPHGQEPPPVTYDDVKDARKIRES